MIYLIEHIHKLLKKTYLFRSQSDFRLLVLSHLDDIDSIDEDILHAPTKVYLTREVRQIFLNHPTNINLKNKWIITKLGENPNES